LAAGQANQQSLAPILRVSAEAVTDSRVGHHLKVGDWVHVGLLVVMDGMIKGKDDIIKDEMN
jgi:hypothetical protein